MNNTLASLESSPMFQLSLSSKELFHSNFLYWLGKTYRDVFEKTMGQLYSLGKNGGTMAAWGERWTIEREKENFDLSVCDGNGNIVFLIENKVKSIPKVRQLDEHLDKTRHSTTSYLLLSLSSEFPGKEDINRHWAIVNYGDLSRILTSNLSTVDNGYHSAIICDYCRFIETFQTLSESWSVSPLSPWKKPDSHLISKLSELRVDDLYKKLRAAQILDLALAKLAHCTQKIEWGRRNIEIFGSSDKPFEKLYVDFGMTNSQGFFEIKVKVDEKTLLLIQVQGAQYRRAIERKGTMDENIIYLRTTDDSLHRFFALSAGVEPSKPYSSAIGTTAPFRPCKKENQDGFCHFGDWFIYQYVKINADTSVEAVVEAVVNDILAFIALGV